LFKQNFNSANSQYSNGHKMIVNVKFVGALRQISGKSKVSVESSEGKSVLKFIEEISQNKPEMKKNLVDQQLEDPKPNALILINGKEISVLEGLDTVLVDGDEVVFIPVVHGG
jgi:sulfur-carrier protein